MRCRFVNNAIPSHAIARIQSEPISHYIRSVHIGSRTEENGITVTAAFVEWKLTLSRTYLCPA